MRLDLVKHGFIRMPNHDFSMNGEKFTCYLPKENSKVMVYKTKKDRQTHLYGLYTGDCGNLSEEECQKLDSYSTVTQFKNIPCTFMTSLEINQFREACIKYETEYENTLQSLLPKQKDIDNYNKETLKIRKQEYKSAVPKVREISYNVMMTASYYDQQVIVSAVRRLEKEATNPKLLTISDLAMSRIERQRYSEKAALQPSYAYTRILEYYKEFNTK